MRIALQLNAVVKSLVETSPEIGHARMLCSGDDEVIRQVDDAMNIAQAQDRSFGYGRVDILLLNGWSANSVQSLVDLKDGLEKRIRAIFTAFSPAGEPRGFDVEVTDHDTGEEGTFKHIRVRIICDTREL